MRSWTASDDETTVRAVARFAEGTSVAPDRSRGEIEKTLARYGADAFSYAYEEGRAVITFRAHERIVRFELGLPLADQFAFSDNGRKRSALAMRQAQDKELRRLWRAMALVIKAKLEAVESGLMDFEEEFLANVLLPDGTTVGDWAVPQVELSYETGQMPEMLPAARPALTGTVEE